MLQKKKKLYYINGFIIFSGRRGGVFHLLGAVSCAKAYRHIWIKSCIVRQLGREGHTVSASAVRHYHVHFWSSVLCVHHHQSNTVPHHVTEIPWSFQGM